MIVILRNDCHEIVLDSKIPSSPLTQCLQFQLLRCPKTCKACLELDPELQEYSPQWIQLSVQVSPANCEGPIEPDKSHPNLLYMATGPIPPRHTYPVTNFQ